MRIAWVVTPVWAIAWLLAGAPANAEFTGWSHCEMFGSAGNSRRYAECGTLTSLEDRANSDGRSIALAVARVPSPAAQPANDAVVVINGGPGGASIEMLADYWNVFAHLGKERDVLAMDQRGTGLSNRLHCAELMETASDATAVSDQVADAIERCKANLDADLRFYTTEEAVHDLEALRAALGYEQLTLYGASYGTRVAQHYLRRFPDRVRAIILDGVVPPGIPLASAIVRNSQDTLDGLFDRCAEQPACNEQFPSLAQDLKDLERRLADPVDVSFRHPVTSEPSNYAVSYAHLAVAIRFALYAPESAATVPLTINRAARHNDLVPLASTAAVTLERLGDAIASAMQFSVLCTEDAPYFDLSEDNLAELRTMYLGDTIVTGTNDICSIWPRGTQHSDIHEPVQSDTPVLVLSGEFDPITPPAWGDQVLPGFATSRHLVAPGQGHGVIARGCMPLLAGQFVDDLLLDELNAECLETLTSFPFFTSPLGPPP